MKSEHIKDKGNKNKGKIKLAPLILENNNNIKYIQKTSVLDDDIKINIK